jgi:hypothetical protein
MKYPFSYTVRGYDYDEKEYYTESGIGLCSDLADAAFQINEYFRDEFVAIQHLELYEGTDLINLSPAAFNAVKDCFNTEEFFRKYETELECEE